MKAFTYLTVLFLSSTSFGNIDSIQRLEKTIERSAANYAQKENFACGGEALYYRIQFKNEQLISLVAVLSAPSNDCALELREIRCQGSFALPNLEEVSFDCEML